MQYQERHRVCQYRRSQETGLVKGAPELRGLGYKVISVSQERGGYAYQLAQGRAGHLSVALWGLQQARYH